MTTLSKARGGAAVAIAATLAAGGLLSLAAPVQAAPVVTQGSGEVIVKDASFAWGVSGYAQVGIFGPWNFKDATGNASFLTGSVSGGTQTEYAVSPVPATSMPVSTPQKTPNAVKFTEGTGRINPDTGAGKLTFAGSYTVNAYPATYQAPNETYTDPELTVAADGSGSLTAEFEAGTGVDVGGNPVAGENFGRLKIATFDAGSLSAQSATGYRITPDYQGVANGLSSQNVTCTTADGATGWWGSWPTEFIDALAESTGGSSILPHFYSTSCGGNQNYKAPLPIDVTFDADVPQVTVSQTSFDAENSATITVEGANFTPELAEATRAPICTSGPPAPCGKTGGTYVAVGKFAAAWRPSTGAASATRKTVAANKGGQKWAVAEENIAGIGGAPAGGIALEDDGTFTATLTVNKADIDALSGLDGSHVNYGIYTYPGGGASAAAFETYTPITFSFATTTAATGLPAESDFGTALTANVAVTGGGGTATGIVEAFDGDTKIAEAELAAGVATIALPVDLAVGTHELTFTYEGDTNNMSSTSEAHDLAIAMAETTTTVTGLPDTAVRGAEVTANIAVTGNGGTVTGTIEAFEGNSKIAEGDLAEGAAVIELPTDLSVGTHQLTFGYSGDANNASSTSAARELAITAAPVVKVNSTPSVSVPASTYGKASTVTVNVPKVGTTAPTGTVTLSGAVAQTATLTNGTATFALPKTLSAGSKALTASYSGDANYKASSASSTLVITKANVSVKRNKITKAPTSKKAGKTSLTVKSTSGGPAVTGKVKVTFKKGNKTKSKTVTIKNGKGNVTIPKLAKGTWKITVKFNGTSNLNKTATKKAGSVKVKK